MNIDLLPEVKVVDRSLLITHVDVEGEQIDRWKGASAQDLKEGWKAVALVVWLWRRGVVVTDGAIMGWAGAVKIHDHEVVGLKRVVWYRSSWSRLTEGSCRTRLFD